jgi:hypothetical protein
MPEVAPVLMVCADGARVEAELVGGLLACPACRGVLGPWGQARARVVRCAFRELRWLRPRRARCRACSRTHVLLADVCLLRRRDEVAVIGAALVAGARGRGHRRVAETLGVPEGTVRGWLRRFAAGRDAIRAHFTRWAFALDPVLGPIVPAGSGFADAVEAIAVAARAWVLRFGLAAVWALVARLSGGCLLCHTSCPFPPVP